MFLRILNSFTSSKHDYRCYKLLLTYMLYIASLLIIIIDLILRFDLPELREACLKALPSAISLDTIIDMLNSMEHFIQVRSI